ncbi:hypothetical protein F3Y22_tig00110621pilonHSYRG00067 [Hibiscus syriacus]|uniref:KNOX2 domain-containing protein n=1 Tax=Hibiscus syriacus TaxID=106335 RepID=A0A6A3A0G9_HIBSY|nr:hypothetical protein F3Y22_tig00110621pilonHSYRG00067 [Hibiscus syriacus]
MTSVHCCKACEHLCKVQKQSTPNIFYISLSRLFLEKKVTPLGRFLWFLTWLHFLKKIGWENHTISDCSEIEADLERDEFMESYCEVIYRCKEELSKPFDEAKMFLTNIKSRLSDLCKGTLIKSLDYLSARRFGPLMSLHFSNVPIHVVSSADAVREITKTHDLIFVNRPKHVFFQILLYDYKDVVSSRYGEYWRQMRIICVLNLLKLLGMSDVGDYLPWLAWVSHVNGFNAKAKKVAKEFDEFLDEVIDEHVNHHNKQVNDFIGIQGKDQKDFRGCSAGDSKAKSRGS